MAYTKDPQISEILTQVHDALKEKGYDPINQLSGYIQSSDPTYITIHNNARTLMRKLEIDDILAELLKAYLE